MSDLAKIEEKEQDVHIGREGWLFLVAGSNSVKDLYKDPSSFTDDHAQRWAELLNGREARLSGMGCQYIHLPAPEKLTVMHDYFDGQIENLEGSPIHYLNKFYSASVPSLLNPLVFFGQQKDDYKLYWKTDTHWSFWGCFSAYQLLCCELGVEPNVNLVGYPYSEGEVLFDLASKLDEPYTETARFYQLAQTAERIGANVLVDFKERNELIDEISLHVGSSVVYKNDSSDAIDKKLILFGDSFAEYRPHLLTGMLAETFSEVHFIWNSSIDFDYVAKVKPDIVVTELAERFMTRVPVDDLNIEKFAQQRVDEFVAKAA